MLLLWGGKEKNLTNKITSSAYIMCVKCTLPLSETKSCSIKSLGDKNKYCVTTCLCTLWDCTLSLCLRAAGCYSGVRKETPNTRRLLHYHLPAMSSFFGASFPTAFARFCGGGTITPECCCCKRIRRATKFRETTA